MALKTASSEVRSRTEIAMVLPVTRRRVKNTTVPIVTIRNWMFPNCLTQFAAKADSVSVLVSFGELANSSSMALATRGASSGFQTRRTYQPIWPLMPGGNSVLEIIPLKPKLSFVVLRTFAVVDAIHVEFPGAADAVDVWS